MAAARAHGARRLSIEQEELRGISRTVAEIHWLLLILVLLYLVFGGVREDAEEAAAVSAGLFFYAALVMSFRYANFYRARRAGRSRSRRSGMIAFITWVLWYTERLASPLLNAYLLPVITSALTLGKVATLANVGADRRLLPLARADRRPRSSLSLRFVAGLRRAARAGAARRLHHHHVLGRHPLRPAAREAALGDRRADRAVQHARLRHRRQPPVRPGAALRPPGERADDRLRQPEGA